VRVLRHAHRLTKPNGVFLDLTTIPPPAVIERDGEPLGSLEQTAFLERARRTEAAVDLLIGDGLLAEEASVPHAVLQHFRSGRELIDDVAERAITRVPVELRDRLERIDEPVVERAFCLLRRLRVKPG
jgi:hypothetical protein